MSASGVSAVRKGFDVTTRSNARLRQAAALVALTGAALAVSATPVAAAPPAIRILSVSSDHVKSGESVRVRFRATNNNQRAGTVLVAVSGGLRCTAGCSATKTLQPGRSQTFNATVVAPKVGPNEQSGRNLAVSVRIGTQTAFDHKLILVGGTTDKPPAGVTRLSGRVRDADGKAVRGATVTVQDSAGHDYRTASTGSGRFSIRSTDSRPIAAGPLAVVATKEGYRTARATTQGTAGGTATVRLTLTATAVPTRTPPSPTATVSPPAATDEPATGASFAAAAPDTNRTGNDGGSGLLLFTILGGLLMAAGLGTLVLLLIRRRSAPVYPADAPTAVLRAVPSHGYQQHGYDVDPLARSYRGPSAPGVGQVLDDAVPRHDR